MNKTVKHLVKLCVAAHTIKTLRCNRVWTCYSNITSFPYSSNSKDHGLPVTSRIENLENDITQVIFLAKTADELFDVMRKYYPSLKSQHAVEIFKMLDNIYRRRHVTDDSIRKRSEFLQLCKILLHNIKSLSPTNAVFVLKMCSYFGVPFTSVISQSLLQVIRQSMLDMPFYSLIDLQYLLKNAENIPLIDALKIAIPLMCEIQLKNKMVNLNITSDLVQALLFLSKKPANDSSMEMVINALLAKEKNIHITHAKKILKYLCHLKHLPDGYKELLQNVQHIIISQMSGLKFFEIQSLLGTLAYNVKVYKNKDFYNEEFADACAKTVISEDHGFQEGIRILTLLCKMDHTQLRLIDYLAAKCFENPQVLNGCNQGSVMFLVIGLATADYKPIFWESMQEIILQKVTKYEYDNRKTVLYFAVSMAVFDCYDSKLIKKVFSQDYIRWQSEMYMSDVYWNLLLLYQAVKIFNPTYKGPWLPQSIIDAAIKYNKLSITKSAVQPALEKAMGGSQYVLSNLKTKLGHHIDHAIVMRKGGYPVAMNLLLEGDSDQSATYVEDLQLPAECQVILVIDLPDNAYAVNSRRLKGNWILLLKTLETHTRHTVIPISLMMWNALMDHEKIPYLMQAIQLKCEDSSASVNAR